MTTGQLLRAPDFKAFVFIMLVVLACTPCARAAGMRLRPFLPVETAAAIARRQACLHDFYSCSDQGAAFAGICCRNGQRCALDVNNNPACCPNEAICTGTAPAPFTTPPPSTPTAASFVPNDFFSFPYVATYFANPGWCSAAVSQCNANYAACTAQLGGSIGGGFAVTIVVPGGGGITVAPVFPGVSVGIESAVSICNSLSSKACYGLQSAMCTLTGTSVGVFHFGTETGNAAPKPTAVAAAAAACAGLMGAIAAVGGAGIGIWR